MGSTQLMFNFPNVQRKFISPQADVAIDSFFPEEEADKLAQIESYNKHLFRPNTYLHKWWARRSGVTFRYILKQLSTKSELRHFYTPGGLEGLTILDPMMGGAMTLHEAIRLGANVIGYDVDPIPVLQARASLTEISLQEKQAAFDPILEKLEQKLSPYFETLCPDCSEKSDMQFLLYGLRRQTNKDEAIFLDSFTLRAETNGDRKTILDFYPSLNVTRENRTWPLMDKDEVKNRGITVKNLELLDVPFADRYVPLVMVGKCKHHGQFFKAPDVRDLQNIAAAASQASRLTFPGNNGFKVPQGPKSSDLIARGVTNFFELFSHRQLLYLSEAKRSIDEAAPEHRLWLALLVSTSLEFNSMLCGYKGGDQRRPAGRRSTRRGLVVPHSQSSAGRLVRVRCRRRPRRRSRQTILDQSGQRSLPVRQSQRAQRRRKTPRTSGRSAATWLGANTRRCQRDAANTGGAAKAIARQRHTGATR